MSIKANWGLMALLAASALGCAQTNPTVRGQSPVAPGGPAGAVTLPADGGGPLIGTAPGYSEQNHPSQGRVTHQDFQIYNGFRDNNFGYEGGYYAGPQGYYSDRNRIYTATPPGGQGNPSGCPACEYGRSCPQGGCQHCGCGCGNGAPYGYPYNYQTYQFKWPQNMVYPPEQVPAGVIQYPYYSLRGPTDFFMK